MKKILVLGGTRFIGFAITKLLSEQFEVVCFHRGFNAPPQPLKIKEVFGDRMKPSDIQKAFSSDYDIVIDVSEQDSQAVSTSAQLAANTVAKYIYISSSSVYKECHPFVYGVDSDLIEDELSIYAQNKIKGEKHVQTYAQNFVILRIAKVYGPYNYIYREKYYYDKLKGDYQITLLNNPLFNFTFVDDVAQAVLDSCNDVPSGIYNIAGSENTKLSKFIDIIADIMGKSPRIENGTQTDAPFSHLSDCVLDCSKSNSVLNWKPTTDLYTGLLTTIQWIEKEAEYGT